MSKSLKHSQFPNLLNGVSKPNWQKWLSRDIIIALEDPKSIFMQYAAPVTIDEIQRAPQLLSYIQVIVDEQKTNGLFILTGSQQLLLNASVSQSLAGRTALVTLLPFSINEVKQFYKGDLQRDQCIINGFLPRKFDQDQEPLVAYRNYLHTYVERDVRQLINLKDLYTFEKMLKLLANDTGVSAKTISHWLSVLEASYIRFRLQPFYENFGKRVIKSSKIYSYRDSHHNEVDLIHKQGERLIPIEIKASQTYNPHFLKSLVRFRSISYNSGTGYVIYAGNQSFITKEEIKVIGFEKAMEIITNPE